MRARGKKITVLDIDSVMEKYDCVPLIINTTRILIKLSKNNAEDT